MNGKRIVWGLAWAMALLLLAAGCGERQSQQESSGEVTITLEAQSLAVGPTTLVITLTDKNGDPVDDAVLSVRGDMAHAGMMPVLADGKGDGAGGVYTVPFDWTMGGDWIVTVEAALADGSNAKQEFDLTVEG